MPPIAPYVEFVETFWVRQTIGSLVPCFGGFLTEGWSHCRPSDLVFVLIKAVFNKPLG